MNNRFTLQDLAGILATQTGRTKKESEEFLREFIRVVSDGAFTDKMVKIKGLGTFKVIEVEDRESVNVNTGKRFIIPGHSKFNFTPDKELKELVNKPFSFFDTTEIHTEDSLQELTATTEEQIETTEEEEDDQEKEIEQEPVENTPQNDEHDEQEESKKEEPLPKSEDRVKIGTVQQKKNKLLLTIILILLVAAVGVLAYFFLHLPGQQPKPAVQTENSIKEVIPDTQDKVEEPELSEPEQTVTTESAPPKVLAYVTIEPGTRLTLISLDYYQHKIFWVYIYEFNKEQIEDPNNIPVGTKLAIPAPEVYGINANDRESIEKASLLQTRIITGEK